MATGIRLSVLIALGSVLTTLPHAQAAQSAACKAAIARFNAAVRRDADQYVADFRRSFGMTPNALAKTKWETPANCKKYIPITESSIARDYVMNDLMRAMRSVCPEPKWTREPRRAEIGQGGTHDFMAEIEGAKAGIRKCEEIIAEGEAASRQTAAAQPQSPASGTPLPGSPQQQSSSCSDISGLGGSGPANCAPSTGVPANIQVQIDQARASMQAARTVQGSDRSPAGQTAAASQYRNAAAAYRLAGDLAQERVALDAALAIENALKQAPVPDGAQPPSRSAALPDNQSSNACPPVAPAQNLQDTPNAEYCANANCVDRGSAYYGYMCFGPSSGSADAGNATRIRQQAPQHFKGAAPDVRGEILTLADSFANLPEDAPERPKQLRKLIRKLANHGMPVKDLTCAQPISGTGPRLVDLPLRWDEYSIKHEAVDRAHLCDDAPKGDAKEACRETKFGEAVMWAEPEVAGQCRTANMPDFNATAIAACAKDVFLSAWDRNEGIVPAPTPANWVMPAWCDPKTNPAQRNNHLRDVLRKMLEGPSSERLRYASPGDKPPDAVASSTPDGPPPPAPLPTSLAADDDEAYCNYMAREIVRGELTPGPATAIPAGCRSTIEAAMGLKAQQKNKPFSMDAAETDREIARLMASPQPSRGR